MAAARHTASFLRQSSRMKPSQLLLATIALSSSCSSSVSFAESFSIGRHQIQSQRSSGTHHRGIHLPPRHSALSADAMDEDGTRASVTGPIYEMENSPTVKLFTKEGCTLCDKVKDVLESLKEDQPHSLYAVDITDDDKQEWFSKYKWDIPVLHINDNYWTKHRLTAEDAIAGIEEASSGDFEAKQGEPDASRLEHN